MKTILILEDDFMLVEEWRDQLERSGYKVVHARTATEAQDAMVAVPIDLALADIFIYEGGKLTPNGGITLLGLSRVAELSGRAVPPIIVVTGAPTDGPYATDALEIAQQMGAAKILRKPVSPALLTEVVREFVGPAR